MRAETRTENTPNATEAERPDLLAWRQRHELRRSNAAQPIPSGRRYRRTTKHRRREQD
ncbi:hypothetical protein [Nocardia jejuensis]|uniref:hypothetical protein n=1 Tax=Nocardia jejuensis TaxID=328049 RepID=UPI000ADE1E20|nr:hypothetical protein [Nocardia jejuensis]